MADTRKQGGDEETGNLIQLEEEDIRGGVSSWINSLIGKLFADKQFSVGTMEGALKAIWGRLEGLRVTDIGGNNFQFFFDREWDVIRIEQGAPWLFKEYALYVQQWKEGVRMEDQLIKTLPIWTQLWGVP
ncbi:uncharacterized protein LOC130950262 [Arachis stenosperma]|uniref:uncharacterized protein LOC130950262 n=1 Tax=Arachis stenosperma TaxID=217475 RepID=UPI0025ACE48B|nr:uncharacterized protein LOC130950262 [Arachis stenosperma]